ncbi:MAG: PAS domain S-box protein [Thermodesulfobacteriota bacterium]
MPPVFQVSLSSGTPRRLYAVLTFCVVCVLVVVVLTWMTGSRMTTHHARFIHTGMRIQLEVTQSHMWLEELLAGDPDVDKESVIEHLEHAEAMTTAMLEGGMGAGESIRGLEKGTLRQTVRELADSLQEYRDQATQRLEAGAALNTREGAASDQRFDALYKVILEHAQTMEEELHRSIRRDLTQFYWMLVGIVVLLVALAALMWINVRKYVRQRNQAQMELADSEETHRTTLMSIGDGVISTDTQGRVRKLNAVAETLTGWSLAEARGRLLEEIFHITNAFTGAPVEAPVHMVLREGRVVGLANHTVLLARDGTRRQIADSASPIYTSSGSIRGVVLVFRDVTEQYAQQRRLEESEAALRALFENAPLGIFRTTSTGQVLQVNPKMAQMVGCASPQEALNHYEDLTIELYADPERRQEFIQQLQQEGEVLQFEYEGVRRNGIRRWFMMNARISEYRSDGSFVIDGFTSDVTERVQAQARVEHLNLVLRAIREVNQLITRETEAGELIRKVSKLMVASRGFTSALVVLVDAAGRPHTWHQAGQESEEFNAPVQEYLQEGNLPPCCGLAQQHDGVLLVPKREGACRGCPQELRCQSLDALCVALGYQERFFGYMAVALPTGRGGDSEEQALFQEAANDVAFALYSLEQGEQARQAEADRERMEYQLQQAQKMEAVGRLAGGVAHDFNNMLNVILGYTTSSLERVAVEEPVYEALNQIHLAAERSADLTRQLLAFSRRQMYQPEVLNLNSLLEKQSKMLSRLIGEDVQLQFVPGEDLWNIRMDPSQVDQILVNLVINARDAMPEGGVISIETANVVLDEAYSSRLLSVEAGEYVLLAVSDTGKGISAEMQEQIFEPFFTTKEKGEGTGLGLSTVYGIVQQNTGFIHMYSEPGSGTTFKIYLPRVGDSAEMEKTPVAETPLTGQETILVVEDEQQLLELIQTVLEEYGYTVLAAGTPEQALQFAQNIEEPIQLMLTDVVMPGMNGKALKREVESHHPSIRVVYMSGYTDNIIVKRGMVDPGLAFIQKPFSMEGLARKIRQVLDAESS